MNGNDFVAFLLRSPLQFMLGNTMLLTVTGRVSGKKYTTPVGYYRDEEGLWVITSRERTWWRNVQDGAQVEMRLGGKDLSGYAEAILDQAAVVARLGAYLQHVPQAARPLGVRMENGAPHPGDAVRLANERLFVKIRLE
jgi:deazaflavin-dependent oxidoreductase (nitroreductase family)